MRSVLALCLIASTAQAQDAMNANEFEDYAEGRTLGYSVGRAAPYGTERYLPNRRVIWTTIDGRCSTGSWYPIEDQICFLYDDDPDEKCWHFFPNGDDLMGIFEQGIGQPYRVSVIDPNDLFACDRFTS
ncbi:hypothetical protein [Cognatiyoonia sp. IB215182]|uniref:hypothetical protein n=1 Tax=Cognatiyoonia sp. IB215182 TaxID=3097353 RepID=UPI002A17DABD|nr:hypothetical protein [Cognatiyoonia sp. IB215182]MDX8354453.1 hypothetical protein [Cognatiyoonia sp. IB215182]